MAFAMNIKTKDKIVNQTFKKEKSWQDNPIGVALTIDAPEPPKPRLETPKDFGNGCPPNPLWSTRFSNDLDDSESWCQLLMLVGLKKWTSMLFLQSNQLQSVMKVLDQNTIQILGQLELLILVFMGCEVLVISMVRYLYLMMMVCWPLFILQSMKLTLTHKEHNSCW